MSSDHVTDSGGTLPLVRPHSQFYGHREIDFTTLFSFYADELWIWYLIVFQSLCRINNEWPVTERGSLIPMWRGQHSKIANAMFKYSLLLKRLCQSYQRGVYIYFLYVVYMKIALGISYKYIIRLTCHNKPWQIRKKLDYS